MEKKYKSFLTDIALANLEDFPSKHIVEILEKIDLLESFPELGFAIQKSRWRGYRLLIVDWYRVVYSIDESKKLVNINFIQHGKMDFQ